jgi:sodium transport system permease protein
VDSTAGERERRSLETLLAQPASPFDVVAGKWLAASLLSVAGLILELGAGHIILRSMALEEAGLSWRLGTGTFLLILLTSVPLCMFAAAIQIAVAINSKTFKEAQTTVSFLLLLPLVPVFAIPLMNIATKPWMYAVPVLAEQTLTLELARGQSLGWIPFLMTAGVSLLCAAISLTFAVFRIRSERFVLGI